MFILLIILAVFGACKKLIMTKDDTIIIEGSGRR